MNEFKRVSKLNEKELLEFLNNLWADFKRMIEAIIIQHEAKGYHEKADEVREQLEKNKQAHLQIRELIKILFAKEISTGPIKKDISRPDLIEWLQGLNQAATAMKDYYVMKATTQLIEMIQKPEGVGKDWWLPTAENINALPEPVRNYIADLETNADPPSMVQENALLRDTCKALEIKLEEKSAVDEGFVNTWANDFATATLADKTMHKRIIYMLKEIDVEVVKK